MRATLRKHYGDEEIVELVVVGVIAYFGFLNRWNDTLATELESSPLNFAQCVLSSTGWSAGKHSPQERSQEAAAGNLVRLESFSESIAAHRVSLRPQPNIDSDHLTRLR
jgi:hypothetical protein